MPRDTLSPGRLVARVIRNEVDEYKRLGPQAYGQRVTNIGKGGALDALAGVGDLAAMAGDIFTAGRPLRQAAYLAEVIKGERKFDPKTFAETGAVPTPVSDAVEQAVPYPQDTQGKVARFGVSMIAPPAAKAGKAGKVAKVAAETADDLAEALVKSRGGKRTAFATHEDEPFAHGGHLTNVNATPEARAQFAADPRSGWRDETGGDIIYRAAGAEVHPTRAATGVYDPGGGAPIENNPAHVALPVVGMKDTHLGPVVDDVSRGTLNTAEAIRAYVDAQGAGAWHLPVVDAPQASATSVFIPQGGPVEASVIERLQAIGRRFDLPDVVDTGRGVTMTRFWPPLPAEGGAQTAANLQGELGAGLQGALPGARPTQVRVGDEASGGYQAQGYDGGDPLLGNSGYLGYEDARKAAPGSGEATRRLVQHLDEAAPLAPGAAEAITADPAFRQRTMDKVMRDAEMLTANPYAPFREDVQNARRILATQGLQGLKAALDRGEFLPAVALAVAGPAAYFSIAGGQQTQASPPV